MTIISLHNKTLNTKYDAVSDSTKSLISDIKSNFLKNTIGLTFTSCASKSYDYSSSASTSYGGGLSKRSVKYRQLSSYNSDNNNAYYQSYDGYKYYYPSTVYNNLLQSPLNDTLDGNVYQICLDKPFIDVYSSDVSVRNSRGLLTYYRDYNFFGYRRPKMPLNINT